MEDNYRCLTCYESLTQEEYVEHKAKGHITVEFLILEDL